MDGQNSINTTTPEHLQRMPHNRRTEDHDGRGDSSTSSTAPTHPVSALIKCLAVCMSSTPAVSVEILTLSTWLFFYYTILC